MELPLTPLDFARRARKLYPQREALVDGPLATVATGGLPPCSGSASNRAIESS